jgi:hypothetical protein
MGTEEEPELTPFQLWMQGLEDEPEQPIEKPEQLKLFDELT